MLSLHKTLPYCQHCKSPHTQRKFKYLFIFRANKTYSQLQNCPVQTRQRRHIQCKSFPCWLGDLRCYEYECYITIVASINCLFWLECKKEKSVWLLTFSPRLGLSFTDGERARRLWCDGLSGGLRESQTETWPGATRLKTTTKKLLKQQSHTKWNFPPIFCFAQLLCFHSFPNKPKVYHNPA